MSNDTRHWDGDVRSDGVSVFSFQSEVTGIVLWGVKARDGHTITLCPCCDKTIRTRDAAQRIADAAYPPAPAS